MRILVTGALGHIGSRLIRAIPADYPGAEIRLVDNLFTQRYCSLFDLPDQATYRFIEADVVTADLARLCRDVDVVIHLAAIIDDDDVAAATIDRVNRGGTERVARACAAAGCRLVFVSTTSVYGTSNGVVDEECPIDDVRPLGPYTSSKWHAEQLLHATAGLRFVICRFGTIVGASPGMRFHTAVSRFCWQAATGTPLTVWRTAVGQQRPYLDLEDASRAVRFLLARDLFDRRVYNVVSLNATVEDVIRTIEAYTWADVPVVYTDPPLPNDASYSVDSRRLARLGFQFTGTLDRGIRETTALLRPLVGRNASVPRR
jgi:nucleoside-diphosphate-sugar epimerase